ncbi:MAG: hypothetical protein A3H98_08925 [Bacteroidetes bacterium RIFCSPLOWO2_02_FULL_36_8]|nr:MAG: hypothetical protein A3H98_08925 [Bacteroidetes bacterium RIFCSPLOWO2_02_FULL_36_8]OFY70493.1 MAG: hypothetical protein A3G23_10245 [Bacteroidetes bacterium RIFCSPLOWO2_12_FULL_37_12]
MQNINSLTNSKENLDYVMAFFYMYKKNLSATQIATSVKIVQAELDIYLNHLTDKKLIDEIPPAPAPNPDPDPSEKKEKITKVYKINFTGIEFCETDSFRNAPDTPADKKQTICKIYSLK